jgi:hypothetical protein
MAETYHILELFKGSELWIHTLVIADAVWRVDCLDLAYRIDRHEPYNIGTQSLDRIKMLSNRIEGLLRGEHARVHLIHHYILRSRYFITRLTYVIAA